jgi:hypothetical protein
MTEPVRWWEIRHAQGQQAKTYTCPLCHGRFLAMVPHVLLSPEGDRDRRRHAHATCVSRRRAAGTLLTKSEWQRSQRPPGAEGRPWWRRLFGAV